MTLIHNLILYIFPLLVVILTFISWGVMHNSLQRVYAPRKADMTAWSMTGIPSLTHIFAIFLAQVPIVGEVLTVIIEFFILMSLLVIHGYVFFRFDIRKVEI